METDDSSPNSSRSPITAELSFDWTKSESVSAAVIDAVAEFTDQEPTEMETLYSAIDPDALDNLIHSSGTRSALNDLDVEFLYDGVRVRVTANGDGIVRSDMAI